MARRSNPVVLISAPKGSKRQHAGKENEQCPKRRRVEKSDDDEMPRSPVTPVKRPIQEEVDAPDAEEPKSCTPSPSKATSNVYAHARSLLRLSSDATGEEEELLLGREAERDLLEGFLKGRLPELYGHDSSTNGEGVLYVSGLPGTGKTALLLETIIRVSSRAEEAGVEILMVNCLSLKEPSDAWISLVDGGNGRSKAELAEMAAEQAVDADRPKRLLILDEADRLATGKRSMLSQIFALANLEGSRLTVVAIANSLDITKLVSEGEQLPKLLHFAPYGEKSLVAIVKQRLSRLRLSYDGSAGSSEKKDELPLFQPVALLLLARKIQAHSGDLRAFLGLVKVAIGLVEEEQVKALPPTPSSTPSRRRGVADLDALSGFTSASAPKVTPKHALSACKTAKSGTNARLAAIDPLAMAITNITLGARLVLVGIALHARDIAGGIVELSKAYSAYLAAIKRAGGRSFVDALSESEWCLTVENLDVAGLVRSSSTPSPSSKAKRHKGSNAKATVELAYPAEKILTTVTTAGKSGECALAITLVDKNRVRKRMEWEGDAEAPRAGFDGDGLEHKVVMGNKRQHEDDFDDF